MRDSILRVCLRMYPPVDRTRDGRVIVDLAAELSSRSRSAFLREAGGLVAGGIRARGRLLRLDVTGAPWHAVRERLALPLAVALLCLFIAFGFPSRLEWIGWWALLALLGAAVAVFAAASRRRALTIVASLFVLALMTFDTTRELTTTHQSRWMGDVGIGEVNMLGMWLPVALLLVASAGAVGRDTGRRHSEMWLVYAPVAASIVLALIEPYWARWTWGLQSWGNPLGLIYVYAPIALVVVTALRGIVRRDAVTKTAAAVLIVASCLPVMWLLAMVLPWWLLAPVAFSPLGYFGLGIVVALVIMMLLLRRRTWSSLRVD